MKRFTLAALAAMMVATPAQAIDMDTIMKRAEPLAQKVIAEADNPKHTLASVASRAGILCNTMFPLIGADSRDERAKGMTLIAMSQLCSAASSAGFTKNKDENAELLVTQMRDAAQDIIR